MRSSSRFLSSSPSKDNCFGLSFTGARGSVGEVGAEGNDRGVFEGKAFGAGDDVEGAILPSSLASCAKALSRSSCLDMVGFVGDDCLAFANDVALDLEREGTGHLITETMGKRYSFKSLFS